jgi:hypothetical protein
MRLRITLNPVLNCKSINPSCPTYTLSAAVAGKSFFALADRAPGGISSVGSPAAER